MDALLQIDLSAESLQSLRTQVHRYPEVIPFSKGGEDLSLMASLGVVREVGTVNDELSRFTFDAQTGKSIPKERLKGTIVQYRGRYGFRIWAEGISEIEIRIVGFRQLLHPEFSFDSEGRVKQVVIFPHTVAKILESEGVELTFVRPWAENTIFGGFNPNQGFYQTNLWELVNNDSLRFAKLLEERRLPFIGTHDLVAHIAGVKKEKWDALVQYSVDVRTTIETYYKGLTDPNIASRVLPYAAGVILDDLAQPPNYDKDGRKIALYEILKNIKETSIDPSKKKVLFNFPQSYEKLILLSREADSTKVQSEVSGLVRAVEQEILLASVNFPKAL